MTKLSKREHTRIRLIDSASKGFRRYGYFGFGVDALSKNANVTSGAFYAHLKSKNNAFLLSLEKGLVEVIDTIPIYQADYGLAWTREFAHYYLGLDHAKNIETGCSLATLTLDIAREEAFQDEKFASHMNTIIALIKQGLAGDDKDSRAWGYLSVLVGGINFVRALPSEQLKHDTSEALISSACTIAGKTQLAQSQ